MVEMGFDESKLHTIYNSLNYDESLKIRKNLTNEPIYINYFKLK